MKTLVLAMTLLMSIPVFSATSEKGGPKKVSLKEWFNKKKEYPNQALENKEEGTVYVSFEINDLGKAANIQIAEGVSESLNQEAIELVEKMPLYELTHKGFIQGKSYILPVKFVLK